MPKSRLRSAFMEPPPSQPLPLTPISLGMWRTIGGNVRATRIPSPRMLQDLADQATVSLLLFVLVPGHLSRCGGIMSAGEARAGEGRCAATQGPVMAKMKKSDFQVLAEK